MRVLMLALLTACSSATSVLGDDPSDDVALSDVPELAHIVAAMDGGDGTVADLFDADLSFTSAPDPTAWLTDQHAEHAALSDGEGTTLSVLTYNVGLLNRTYLLSRVEVPFTAERAVVMGERVFDQGHDIVFLQEVWEVEDAERIATAGRDAGYVVVHPDERQLQRETGLLMAVRSELIGTDNGMNVVQYEAQWGSENFPGPNLKRGYLHWSLTLAEDDTPLHLFDTHLTPFYDKWQTRNLQVRELGLAVSALPDDALTLVGGDFNAGWYYPNDVWTDADGKDFEGWWRNPTMPALLSYYGGLTDLANLAERSPEVERGDAVPQDADSSWLDTPYGDASRCDAQDHFTATDCNSLYRTSYAATEFPARMDLLFVRDGIGQMRARSRSLAFVEPIEVPGAGTIELSDHYGQQVSIEWVTAP